MRLAAAVLFVLFICTECKPGFNLGGIKLRKNAENIHIAKEVVGSDTIEVRKDGSIDLDNVKTSERQSGTSDGQQSTYTDGYYNENDDGSSRSRSETHQMDKQSESKNKHKETTHNGLQVGPGGLTIYDKKKTEDDSMTHDLEYRRDAYEDNANGPGSNSHTQAEYESLKEKTTRDMKTKTEANEYNLGLGGSKVKQNKGSTDEYEEERSESLRFREQNEDYKRTSGQTTHTESNYGGELKSSNVNKTKRKNTGTEGQVQKQHKLGQTKNGLRFPDEFYTYLNIDSRKLGLSGAYPHNRGNMTNSRYDDIRQDYLLTVARELYSKSKRVDSGNSSSILQSLKSHRKSPVPSHYANIKFVEDKFSKLPTHYYTAVKYGVIDPDVKKAIFSHDLSNLRKIQHTPRNVNNVFKSIGYNRYREKYTTAHKNNLHETIINKNMAAVSDSNKNEEVIRHDAETIEPNKYARYNNASPALNDEDVNKVSTVGLSDSFNSGSKSISISVKAHNDDNSADDISKIDSGSYDAPHNDGSGDNTFSNHIKNSKMESTGSDEVYNTTMSEDGALSASYTQALPDTKSVNTSIDKADSINAAIMSADSYDDKLDNNDENTANITELNSYSNDDERNKTSDVNSTDTLDLPDAGTNYFDVLSTPKTKSADSVTEVYDYLNNATFTIDNVDGQSYDFDKSVTSTSLYPNLNSADEIATDLPSAAGSVLSDKNTDGILQEYNTWSSTLIPYIDSNSIDGTANNNFDSNLNTSISTTTYSDTNSSDENFLSGNKAIDTSFDSYENKTGNNVSDTSIATATISSKTNSADDLAPDNTAMSIDDQFNTSTDATDINGFSTNFMDSDSSVDTSTTYLLTNSVNNFDKSDSVTMDYFNSDSNNTDLSIVTTTMSSVTHSTDDLSSDDIAVDMNNTFSYLNDTTDVNGSESSFNASDGSRNSVTINKSADTFASDDMAIELAADVGNSSTTVTMNDTNSNINGSATLNVTTPLYLDTNSENSFTADDSISTESAFSNLTDNSVILSTTDMTILVYNSTDAFTPAKTSNNLATDLKNVSESTANDDSDSNFSETTVLTTTIFPMNNNADDFASSTMAKDIANKNSNLSDSMAINVSETELNDSEIILSTEPSFSITNSSDSFDTDEIVTDIAKEYNNSPDDVSIDNFDSNFTESVPTATTYSMSDATDNFGADLTADIDVVKNLSDTIITDNFYDNTNNTDISISTEITSSTISNADEHALDNITIDAENVTDSMIVDDVGDNSKVSDTLITTETISLKANSSDVHENSSEAKVPDLTYSYFDSAPNDNVTTDTELLTSNSSGLIDSNISTTERNAVQSSNDFSNTETNTDSYLSTTPATESNISNTGSTINSTAVNNPDVSSDTKDTPDSVQGTNSGSNLELSPPSVTSDSGGTSNIDKSGSSIISNNPFTTIPNNISTAGVAKKLNSDNTPGQNGAAGDKDKTAKPVSVKRKNDKFVFSEEAESKSGEDVSVIGSNSSEQPMFTSIDSSRLESGSGSMSIETP